MQLCERHASTAQQDKFDVISSRIGKSPCIPFCPTNDLIPFQLVGQEVRLSKSVTSWLDHFYHDQYSEKIYRTLENHLPLLDAFIDKELIDPKALLQCCDALKQRDSELCESLFTDVISNGVSQILQGVISRVEQVLKGVRGADKMMARLYEYDLYSLVFEVNNGLSYCSSDFMQHLDLDLDLLPKNKQYLLLSIINYLKKYSDGIMQTDLYHVRFMEVFEFKSKKTLKSVLDIIKNIEKTEDIEEVKQLIIEARANEEWEKFYSSFQEVCFEDIFEPESNSDNLSSFVECLQNHFDEAKVFFDQNIAMLSIKTKRLEDIVVPKSIKNSNFGNIANRIIRHLKHNPFNTEEGLEQKDETMPYLGMVLRPFSESSELSELLNVVSQGCYEDSMNCGEDVDSWSVNYSEPEWLRSLQQRMFSTALIILLVESIQFSERKSALVPE